MMFFFCKTSCYGCCSMNHDE
uniref:Uncharacterized protein n=1 Tax=Arundo donax TaxID=35708 RepID=A0A0A9FRS6_ARUDO